jgi:hypothetical protein
LRMARKQLTAKELSEFRKDLYALKKAGVVPKSVNTRTAIPSTVIHSSGTGKKQKIQTAREAVKKFKAATPSKNAGEIVTVSRKEALQFKKLGYTIQGDKVVIPRAPSEKVSINKQGQVRVIDTRNGVERIYLPVEYHNLPQYLHDLHDNSKEIQRMKRANERFGFKLRGYNSHRTFRDFNQMIDYFAAYQSVEVAIDEDDPEQQRELYEILEIVKIPSGKQYEFMENRPAKKRGSGSKSKAAQRKNWPQYKRDAYKAKRRVEEQKRRDRKKGKIK